MIPTLNLRMFRNSVSVTALVGWAFVQPAPAADASKFNETVLYSFCSQQNCMDAATPDATLTNVKGTLYGTAEYGGAGNCSSGLCGAVFALDPNTGAEKLAYSFCSKQNCIDGAVPNSSLTHVNGRLYSVTLYGGAVDKCGFDNTLGCGTVFALDPKTGAEKVLYSFCSQQNCADGQAPEGGLISVGGTLYGTTSFGGNSSNSGVVFAIDPNTGAETLLHSFGSGTDGGGPQGNLIDLNGVLYGTTSGGGNSKNGTVFAFDLATGSETMLYSFCSQQNCTDGSMPVAGLIAVNGALYGTTTGGGAHNAGTVFALDPNTGTETVIYSFCSKTNCKDGAYPQASLIDVKGKLYGTAAFGGANCAGSNRCGTVFSLNLTTKAETVLYDFCGQQNCVDGATPGAGLTDVKGTLYGTTIDGGTGNCSYAGACGVVFALAKL